MTDINVSQSIPNEPPFEETASLTELDITEQDGTLDIHHPCQDHHDHQRLHSPGDSESEEDLTEEHVDTNLLENQLHNLHLDPIPTLETTTDSTTQQDCNAGTLHPTVEQAERAEQADTINPLPPTHSTSNTSRGRSSSSVSPSTVVGLLPRSQRVWEMDRQAPECRRCHRRFNFLVRRHHCR